MENDNDFHSRLMQATEPMDSEKIAVIRQYAKKFNLCFILGFAERCLDKIYNSAAFISKQGEILSIYRKVHCRDFESNKYHGPYTPGDRFNVESVKIQSHLNYIGTMICFDREIPESVRCLRSLGAELIVCPLATNTRLFSNNISYADNETITQC